MRFLIGVVCVIALFGAVYAQDQCELCKAAVDALDELAGEFTERDCQNTVSSQARYMCSDLFDAKNLLSDLTQTIEKICEALGYCGPPPGSNSDYAVIGKAAGAAAGTIAGPTGLQWFFYQLLRYFGPAVPELHPIFRTARLDRRKRDLGSTEREMAGIYGEEEDNPFEYMDPTLNPSSNLPEETDAYMKQVASSLKCELCKLGIAIDSSNATLLRTGQDGAPMRKLLCRSLPGKGDQRKCMTVLRQASEILLQILGSIFDSLETCDGLKSCQVG